MGTRTNLGIRIKPGCCVARIPIAIALVVLVNGGGYTTTATWSTKMRTITITLLPVQGTIPLYRFNEKYFGSSKSYRYYYYQQLFIIYYISYFILLFTQYAYFYLLWLPVILDRGVFYKYCNRNVLCVPHSSSISLPFLQLMIVLSLSSSIG